MDLAELEVLNTLAQEGSFSRTAERLHRSQPAVSQSLRRLEDEVGVQLLDRTSRKVILTNAGRALMVYAQRMLQLREDAFRTLEDLRTFKRGVLRLAAMECVSNYLLPPLLRTFRHAFPSIRVELLQSPSPAIPALLLDQDMDFGFMAFPPVHHELVSRVLFRDDVVLVVPPGHPLAGRESVELERLGGERFIGHLARSPTRKRIMELFTQRGVPLQIVLELSSLETIKDFVKTREGVAFLPRMAVIRELTSGELVAPRVRGVSVARDIRVSSRRSRRPGPPASAFQDLLDRTFPDPDSGEEDFPQIS